MTTPPEKLKAATEAVLAELSDKPQTAKAIADKLGISTTIVTNALNRLRTYSHTCQVGSKGWISGAAATEGLDNLESAFRSMKGAPPKPTHIDDECEPDILKVTKLYGGSGIEEHTPRGRIIKFGTKHKPAADTIGSRLSSTPANGVSCQGMNTGLVA